MTSWAHPFVRSSLLSALVAAACGEAPSTTANTTETTTGETTEAATGAPGTTGPGAPTTGPADTGDASSEVGDESSSGGESSDDSGSSSSGDDSSGGSSSSSGGEEIVYQDVYPLSVQYPEGGAFDPADAAFYVGSLGDGSVNRVDAASGEESVVFLEDAPGTWWTLGMEVDVVQRRLWVCAMDDRSPDPRAGYIWIFDLTTGERVRNHALADAATDATCTDVALTADGRGYVGDREMGNVYLVDLDAGASLFATSPDLEAAFVGQNSLVVLPDGSALLSLLYLPSGIARVDLQDATVTTVAIDGTFSDLSPLAGSDGMVYVDGGLYVAFTSKLARVTPTLADWSQAESVVEDVESGMTDVVVTPGGLYMLNGQSIGFAIGSRPDPFLLTRYLGDL